MRGFLAMLVGCMLAGAPVIAVGWDESWLDQAPQPIERAAESSPADGRMDAGWHRLDGWMRGDPMLRHWVLNRFDLDGDALLSDQEAAMARRGFYVMADANRSGIINPDEFVSGWVRARQDLRRYYGFDVG